MRFNRYADDMHRYAARRLGTETADDLMAETFVIAFQQRRRYDVSRPQARSWLYGIVTSLVGRAPARRGPQATRRPTPAWGSE